MVSPETTWLTYQLFRYDNLWIIHVSLTFEQSLDWQMLLCFWKCQSHLRSWFQMSVSIFDLNWQVGLCCEFPLCFCVKVELESQENGNEIIDRYSVEVLHNGAWAIILSKLLHLVNLKFQHKTLITRRKEIRQSTFWENRFVNPSYFFFQKSEKSVQ